MLAVACYITGDGSFDSGRREAGEGVIGRRASYGLLLEAPRTVQELPVY